MAGKRHVVGIDLGTSNTVVARARREASSEAPEVLPVAQLVAPGLVEGRPLYPSCLFAALPGEAGGDPFGELPWVSGELARRRGAEVPGRLVASAKSWLCHAGVDRGAPILPYGVPDEDVPRVSPVAASALFLAHLRRVHDEAFPGDPLTSQEIVLTVPASFDDAARSLTLRAAAEAGLSPVLLEEPLAAFYDYLEREHELASLVDARGGEARVLVCDVGGGTTDLSLVRVARRAGGDLDLARVASGRHLLLGGDNMDLALAHLAESRMVPAPERLAPALFSQLVHACRAAKESLLGAGAPAEAVVRLARPGAKLVGNMLTATLTREDAEKTVLEGFFPDVDPDEPPARPRAALVSFGLPYEKDVAVPRHALRFLRRHGGHGAVDAVLLNGGVFRAERIAARLVAWLSRVAGREVVRLPLADPDVAVARGAVAYGLARAGLRPRIDASSVRAYYLGLAGGAQAVCVAPKGAREGERHVAQGRAFHLVVGKPVRFDLYASEDRDADRPGNLVTVDDTFERLPPVATAIDQSHQRRAAEDVTVLLSGEIGATGTLALRCEEPPEPEGMGRVFELAFDLRPEPERSARGASLPPPSVSPKLEEARAAIERVFGKSATATPREVKDLQRDLERILGERASWTGPTLRALFDTLAHNPGGRRRSADHERVFFALAGYCARPGFGDPGDPARVDLMARLFPERLGFPSETRGWQQLFIAYRRVAGGMDEAAQAMIRDTLDPVIAPKEAGLPRNKKFQPLAQAELTELASFLERVPASRREALGEWLLERTWTDASPALWAAIGRVGARVPAYAGVDHVVAPKAVERWLDHLTRQSWKGIATAADAAARMARLTGDRARDLSPRARKDLERKLTREGGRPEQLRALREVVPLEAKDQADMFGDALPVGLKLAAGPRVRVD